MSVVSLSISQFILCSTEGLTEESICGRPLGMAFDTRGNNLIVADAYYGIWSVDLGNGKKTLLVSPNEELDGTVNISLFMSMHFTIRK